MNDEQNSIGTNDSQGSTVNNTGKISPDKPQSYGTESIQKGLKPDSYGTQRLLGGIGYDANTENMYE